MKHLKMHKKRRKDHFSQTMSYDLFYDDLCEEPIKVHALCIYEKTMLQIP